MKSNPKERHRPSMQTDCTTIPPLSTLSSRRSFLFGSGASLISANIPASASVWPGEQRLKQGSKHIGIKPIGRIDADHNACATYYAGAASSRFLESGVRSSVISFPQPSEFTYGFPVFQSSIREQPLAWPHNPINWRRRWPMTRQEYDCDWSSICIIAAVLLDEGDWMDVLATALFCASRDESVIAVLATTQTGDPQSRERSKVIIETLRPFVAGLVLPVLPNQTAMDCRSAFERVEACTDAIRALIRGQLDQGFVACDMLDVRRPLSARGRRAFVRQLVIPSPTDREGIWRLVRETIIDRMPRPSLSAAVFLTIRSSFLGEKDGPGLDDADSAARAFTCWGAEMIFTFSWSPPAHGAWMDITAMIVDNYPSYCSDILAFESIVVSA